MQCPLSVKDARGRFLIAKPHDTSVSWGFCIEKVLEPIWVLFAEVTAEHFCAHAQYVIHNASVTIPVQ
jgi:hypothetical protein